MNKAIKQNQHHIWSQDLRLLYKFLNILLVYKLQFINCL